VANQETYLWKILASGCGRLLYLRQGRRRGSVVLLVALSLPVLISFAGLAVDVGLLWTVKRQMQTAADAAAVAAATALRNGQSHELAAKELSSLNGFTDGAQGVTVTANHPPAIGRYAGNNDYIEVIVAEPQPSFFMRLLGPPSMTVRARAVASGLTFSGPNCVYALNPYSPDAIHVDGGDNLTSSCGVFANSSSQRAITADGYISAPSVGVVGNYAGTLRSASVKTGLAPSADPLAYLQPPSVSFCTATNFSLKKGIATLNPGVYCGGITLSGNANVALASGTYILNGGGLSLTGTSALIGAGVTIYNTGTVATYKPIFTQDDVTINLSAPTSGPLQGILFFQDRRIVSTAPNILGGGRGKFEGALYFPSAPLVLSSQQVVTSRYTIIVADTIGVYVNSFTIANDYSSLGKGSPIKATVLYE